MATTISRVWYNSLIDDDGSGTTGSICDKADVDSLLDAIDLIFGGPAPVSFAPTVSLGLGTDTPGAKLDIAQVSGGSALRIRNTSPGGTIGWTFYPVTNGANTDMRMYEDAIVGGDRFTFQAGGNFGVGVMVPEAKVDIGALSGGTALRIVNINASNRGWAWYPVSSGPATDLRMYEFAGPGVSGDRMSFATGGNVGINITAPAARLDIAQTSGGNVLKLTNADTAGMGWAFYQMLNGAYSDLRIYEYGANGDRICIRANGGFLGLGTMAPQSQLHVIGCVQVGNPTNGDRGNGTINVSGDVYKNGQAYFNPAFVFERVYAGRIARFADRAAAAGCSDYDGPLALEAVEAFTREHFELPLMARHPHSGLFDRGDLLLASLEEAYLHLFDLSRTVSALRARIDALEGRA
jgi:hypothetical protein